jgi:hypothetical protein
MPNNLIAAGDLCARAYDVRIADARGVRQRLDTLDPFGLVDLRLFCQCMNLTFKAQVGDVDRLLYTSARVCVCAPP